MKKIGSLSRKILIGTLVGFATAVAVSFLLINIFERKQEGRTPLYQNVPLTDDTEDPAIWGANFPHQYESYKKTVDQVRTRFGGSEALPHTPTDVDPRSVIAQSKLEEDPRLKKMWAGYAFSKDFREERGHAFMLIDQIFTERQRVVKQPGTCIHCHASTYVPMKKLGNGDIQKGFAALNAMPYSDARTHVQHPVTCLDCHDSQTMNLRVTRPAFMNGIKKVKLLEGKKDYDVNAMATRQEMRSYVCAQCHVEYYFAGPEKTLTLPWDKGLRADEILSYYEDVKFTDWKHAESGAPVLKAQHPEFELWSQGTHARAGVACADCHMPYQRVGAQKVSDHHVRSPLLNINAACQTCHRAAEPELLARVDIIQSRHFELRNKAMDLLLKVIDQLKEVKDRGVPESELEPIFALQRRSQFLLDFAEAENSTGFHADQEGARVLALSMEASAQALDLLGRQRAGER